MMYCRDKADGERIVAEATERILAARQAALEAEAQDDGAEESDEESIAPAPDASEDEKEDIDCNLISIVEANLFRELAEKLRLHGLSAMQVFIPGSEPVAEMLQGDVATPMQTLSELYTKITDIGRQGITIQRYKGLGEMNSEQLYETTMNPAKRKMLRVTMDDAVQAEKMFSLLMGELVEPRREYIEKYAESVKDLDI